jgi:hypothetical protein
LNPVSRFWENIGLRLKLQILIQGFLIVILFVAQQSITIQLEKQVFSAAEERVSARI